MRKTILIIAALLVFSDMGYADYKESKETGREKKLKELQERFKWWPTDAQPGPVKDEVRGGYWWWPLALLAPLMMYWLLVYASGIPPLEAHMLRSRGAKFRAYQERVNAFFPGPRREGRSRRSDGRKR